MDFSGKLVLAFLEEDNPRRGLFHVRPLLTESGPVPQSDIDAFQDGGYIRIVPDKNEQYTFKDRMRTLGEICLMNLKDYTEEAGKLRPNRNYNPTRGEPHQYILYSNAVQPLPEDLVFEVVAGKPDAPVASCLTPCCYLREGGRIEGPYHQKDGKLCSTPSALRPDSAQLYSITLPSGQERLFYWPIAKEESLPQEEPSAKDLIRMMDEALPDLENTIHEETAFRLPEPKEAPQLTGTPIYHVTAKHAPIKRAHNELHAVVGRYAKDCLLEAPGATMDDVSQLQQVESPVDVFKKNLDALWDMPDCREQVVSYLISQPSAPQVLIRSMMSSQDCTVHAAMNHQLEDLEAERLSLLMQLDKAKEDKQKLLREALDGAEKKAKEGIERLEKEQEGIKASMETLAEQQHTLLAERQKLLDELEALGGPGKLLAPGKGEKTMLDDLADRVLRHYSSFGLHALRDEAMHTVVLTTLFDQVQVACGPKADAFALCKVLARALGAECAVNIPHQPLAYLAGGDGPALSIEQEGLAEDAPYLRLIPGEGAQPEGSAYALNPWPCLLMNPCSHGTGKTLPVETPFSMAALKAELDSLAAEALPEEAVVVVDKACAFLQQQGKPLPSCVRSMLMRYLMTAANVLDGGIAMALDLGISSFLIPHLRGQAVDTSSLSARLSCLPRTAQWL